jgi:hypothetical protein
VVGEPFDQWTDRARPHHSPNMTQADVVEKIISLRKHYHFGRARIAMYLARCPDVAISTSGMWRILKRLGLNRLPASQRYKRHNIRWKRYEKQPPGHQLQIDVKFIESLGQRASRRKNARARQSGGRVSSHVAADPCAPYADVDIIH